MRKLVECFRAYPSRFADRRKSLAARKKKRPKPSFFTLATIPKPCRSKSFLDARWWAQEEGQGKCSPWLSYNKYKRLAGRGWMARSNTTATRPAQSNNLALSAHRRCARPLLARPLANCLMVPVCGGDATTRSPKRATSVEKTWKNRCSRLFAEGEYGWPRPQARLITSTRIDKMPRKR